MGGNVRPLKAMVLQVAHDVPTTLPSPLPQPTLGHHGLGTCAWAGMAKWVACLDGQQGKAAAGVATWAAEGG